MKKREHHGHAANGKMTPTYRSWRMMRNRCNNPNAEDREYYGERGIIVCDSWNESFQNFLDDMGERPKGTTLDRYPDKDGNYEPGNCRWATEEQQKQNTRRNRFVTIYGETKLLEVWCRQYGIDHSIACHRMDKLGWPSEAAFELEHNWQYRGKDAIEIGCFIGTLGEWSDALKLNRNTIKSRVYRQGMPAQEALGVGC